MIKIRVITTIAIIHLLLSGCSMYTNENNILRKKLPQNFVLNHPIDSIYYAIIEEVKSLSDFKLLVENKNNNYLIISWISTIKNRNEKFHYSLSDSDIIKNHAPLSAITTIMVEKTNEESLVSIRQIYLPKKSIGGISHSRGDYEYYLIQKIISRIEKRIAK
ncbi:hypothetical protein MHK_005274 [Candidatus Magnetomorum sp. HK-1]|nr:hypothetical protein MHK_005274 [Candidatus Magnetomorum sp. HK-1]